MTLTDSNINVKELNLIDVTTLLGIKKQELEKIKSNTNTPPFIVGVVKNLNRDIIILKEHLTNLKEVTSTEYIINAIENKAILKKLEELKSCHLKRYPTDKLRVINLDVHQKNGITFLSAEYERINADIFNLLYFRVVMFNSNVIYKKSNVLCYNKETFKPYLCDQLNNEFKNFIYHINKKL